MNRRSGSPTYAIRAIIGIFSAVILLAGPLLAAESGDTQLFISGFNAYQKEEYGTAVQNFTRVLREYPATPLRDMSLFWLSHAAFRAGDQAEAARAMSQFLKDYPDHPLKGTVDRNLIALADQYRREHVVAVTPESEQPGPAAPAAPAAVRMVGGAAALPPAEQPAPVARVNPEPPLKPAQDSLPDDTAAVSRAETQPVAPASPAVPVVPQTSGQTVIASAHTPGVEPQSARKDQRLRRSELKNTYRERAIADFRSIMKNYPGTTAAREAAERLWKLGGSPERQLFDRAMTHFRKKRYQSALDLFDRFLLEYPESSRAAAATLYRGECYLNLSRQ